jgi:hypothetical protein
MQFPRSTQADGWHAQRSTARPLAHAPIASRDADALSPPLHSRRFHAAAMLVAIAALGASAGLDMIDDPRPLDVQLSAAMNNAADTLRGWQNHLSRGLQVSLRAVADGRDAAPQAAPDAAALVAQSQSPAIDADDRDQPVHADMPPQPREPQAAR